MRERISETYDGQPYKIVQAGRVIGWTRAPLDDVMRATLREIGEDLRYLTVRNRKTGDA